MKTLLFVGLGNKGSEYKNTRHNIGFNFIDILAENLKIQNRETAKFLSLVFTFEYKDYKIICAKPQTFMNLSGDAVLQIVNFYKIPIENIFVFHDDIDLPTSKIKFKIGGGDAGHNGLKSITKAIGLGYIRIRIGVGRPMHGEVSDFVLSKFKPEELSEISFKMQELCSNLDFLIEKKLSILAEKIT